MSKLVVLLTERITKAAAALRKAKQGQHTNSCPIEDPESFAPCNCGASSANGPIQEALEHLNLNTLPDVP